MDKKYPWMSVKGYIKSGIDGWSLQRSMHLVAAKHSKPFGAQSLAWAL